MSTLQKELETYKKALPTLLPEEGKYVLIYGDQVLGVYAAYDEALKAGYTTAKLAPFLVKKISGSETLAYFSRDIDCCSPWPTTPSA